MHTIYEKYFDSCIMFSSKKQNNVESLERLKKNHFPCLHFQYTAHLEIFIQIMYMYILKGNRTKGLGPPYIASKIIHWKLSQP